MPHILDHAGNPIQSRNLALSSPFLAVSGVPEANPFSVSSAVKEGLSSSVWVFCCVKKITDNAKQIPFEVVDDSDAPVKNHPVTKLLASMNPFVSREKTMEMVYTWLLLAGVGYLVMDDGKSKGRPAALNAVSPDRISPIPSKELTGPLVAGYALAGGSSDIAMAEDRVIAFSMANPEKPGLNGVSPLKAASLVVDLDISMEKFNTSAMSNQGVPSGLLNYKESLSHDQYQTIQEGLRQRLLGPSNAKTILVTHGSEVDYTQFSRTPDELGYIESSNQAKIKICAAFGVPTMLVSPESTTFTNMEAAERLLWTGTICPMVDDAADTLTFVLSRQKMLAPGLRVRADYSKIAALRDDTDKKFKTAETGWKMGIPVDELNSRHQLGLGKFPGSDLPWGGSKPPGGVVEQPATQRSAMTRARQYELIRAADRNIEAERERQEKYADAVAAKVYQPFLAGWGHRFKVAIEDGSPEGAEERVKPVLTAMDKAWGPLLAREMLNAAMLGASNVVINTRASVGNSALEMEIKRQLDEEESILVEKSHISETTVNDVISQIRDITDAGGTVGQMSEALTDLGTFSPERALRISRTVSGAAGALGQEVAGREAGAEVKFWSSGASARDKHSRRNGERAPINGRYTRIASENGVFPRRPLDGSLSPADRINCRCAQYFTIDDNEE